MGNGGILVKGCEKLLGCLLEVRKLRVQGPTLLHAWGRTSNFSLSGKYLAAYALKLSAVI